MKTKLLLLIILILNPLVLLGQETLQNKIEETKVELSNPAQGAIVYQNVKTKPQVQVDLMGQWNFTPSTVANEAEFLLSKIQFENRWELSEQIKFTLGAQWKSANKADLDQAGTSSLTKAFLSFPVRTESELNRQWLNYGLNPSMWMQISEGLWGVKDSSKLFGDVFTKYNYENEKDLGFSLQGCGESYFYAVSLVNGEGVRSRETSGKKEISVMLQNQWTEHFSTLLQYVSGSYDQYDLDVQSKIRTRGLLSYKNESNQFFIEYGKTKDPADALSLLAMGNTFDAVPYSGKSLNGELISLRHSYLINHKLKTMLQADQVTPHLELKELVLKSLALGLYFQMTQELNWTLALSETNRTQKYGLGSEKDQYLRVNTQLKF